MWQSRVKQLQANTLQQMLESLSKKTEMRSGGHRIMEMGGVFANGSRAANDNSRHPFYQTLSAGDDQDSINSPRMIGQPPPPTVNVSFNEDLPMSSKHANQKTPKNE